MSGPAPAGGVTIELKSNADKVANVPSEVFVPAGAIDDATLERLLDKESGLKGVSGQTSDMEKLLELRASGNAAAFAELRKRLPGNIADLYITCLDPVEKGSTTHSGGLSLVFWLGVIACGRMLAYL